MNTRSSNSPNWRGDMDSPPYRSRFTLPQSVHQALQAAAKKLHGVDSPHLEAEILLGFVMGRDRAWLHTWPEHPLSDADTQRLGALLTRRIQGEPIAHLTGQREFWDMTLTVTRDTLIPRPETERLVELALERIPADARWQVADLGTGSGAIALAIARERPYCHLTATDLSPRALAVARDNALRLKVTNIRFQNSHWFASLEDQRFAMILSNPPYIHPTDPHLELGDVRFEPQGALCSAPDGLADIRHIATTARAHLSAPGWLILEHGHDQGPTVTALLAELGYQEVQLAQDLAGNDRVSLGKWDKSPP